ncbi:MAG: membrane dipeptidase [candidate division Zixibacteria bacterium]|nr:membrane dipeptidase [candidate division Zixibacteria bacterium]
MREGARQQLSRRQFVSRALGTLGGALFSSPLLGLLSCGVPPPLTNRNTRRVLADLHVHSMINEWNKQTALGVRYPGVAGIAGKMFNASGMDWKKCYDAGVDLLCVTHFNVFDEWLSMPTDPDPEAARKTYMMMDQLEAHLRDKVSQYATLAMNADEMKTLLSVSKDTSEWRIPVVHTVEGGHALGGDLSVVEEFAKRGTAIMTVTHFFNKGIASSANSFPYFPDANSPWPHQGLSEFGKRVISEMEEHGIIVDITHATTTSVDQILQHTTKPVLATHTSSRSLGDHPYSLVDEHIEEIAAGGGLIGILIDPYLLSNYSSASEAEEHGTLRDVVRTIEYLVKLVGHKCVAIGSDFGGFITPPKDMKRLSQIGKLREMMRREFQSETFVDDILANNAIEFLQENWGAKSK